MASSRSNRVLATPKPTTTPGVHVALLRGINVGGKNKLPMKELVALFEQAGCANVETYIQSGNVVFEADEALASRVPLVLTAAIAKRHGLTVPIVVRTAEQLANAFRAHPFRETTGSTDELHFVFLADAPDEKRVASLDPNRSPGDAFVVKGAEIYLRLPNGVGVTKLTNAYFDSKLGTTSTARNHRTVEELVKRSSR